MASVKIDQMNLNTSIVQSILRKVDFAVQRIKWKLCYKDDGSG